MHTSYYILCLCTYYAVSQDVNIQSMVSEREDSSSDFTGGTGDSGYSGYSGAGDLKEWQMRSPPAPYREVAGLV